MPIKEKQGESGDKKHVNPIPTADIILRRSGREPQQILIETRSRDPFKGRYSLPGGHVDYGETVEEAALRELSEECGVKANLVTILGVYSDPHRDPRGQRISTVFIGDYAVGNLKAGDDAKSADWMNLKEILQKKESIAFDHHQILNDYHKWLQKSESSETFWSKKKKS